MIEYRGVVKRFAGQTAVDGIDLAVPSGQTTVLLGPSGCGKSTLLRLAIGLIAADEGSVSLGPKRITPASTPAMRRRVGYVIQDGGLFPHLNARENVCLMARHLGWDQPRIDQRLGQLAEITRFPVDGLERYPLQLSGGECQRVALMRALMLDPDLLLLDEPLGSLDPMIRVELQEDLRGIFQSLSKTVVMVTHDIAEAGFFADLIVLIRDGRIVQKGSLADLMKRPAEPFVEAFINAQRISYAALERF